VLGTDGSSYLFLDVLAVPDPTGHAGQQLGTDGEAIFWEAKQTIPTYDADNLPGGIEQGSTSYQIGNMLVQSGSDTAPTAAAAYTSKAVTFATAFAAAPVFIGIEPNTDNVTPAGALVSFAVTSRSTTGFTVKFYAGQEHGSNDWFITSAVNFKYQATGIVA
jgi:hypothetical protein